MIGYYFEIGVDELRIIFTKRADLEEHLRNSPELDADNILEILDADGTYMDEEHEVYIAEVHDIV